MKGAWVISVGLILVLLLAVPGARAAATRAEYVTQAEPICKAEIKTLNMKAKKVFKTLKGLKFLDEDRPKHPTKAQRRRERRESLRFLHAFGRVYIFDAKGIHSMDARLAAIPPPAADSDVFAQWINSRSSIAESLKQIGQTMRQNKVKRSLKALSKAFDVESKLDASDRIVGDWGFRQCLLGSGSQAPTL